MYVYTSFVVFAVILAIVDWWSSLGAGLLRGAELLRQGPDASLETIVNSTNSINVVILFVSITFIIIIISIIIN